MLFELNKVTVEDRGKKRLWIMAFYAVRSRASCKHCEENHVQNARYLNIRELTDTCKRVLDSDAIA